MSIWFRARSFQMPAMESLESPFLKNKEIAELQCELARQGYTACYPSIVKGGCTATCLSSYVIGPRGEIYKCWEDVGIKEREIGSVYEERFTNQSLLEKYVLNGSHMNNPECWECRLLPICKTDCAKKDWKIYMKENIMNFAVCLKMTKVH